jgi:hypothetical protein
MLVRVETITTAIAAVRVKEEHLTQASNNNDFCFCKYYLWVRAIVELKEEDIRQSLPMLEMPTLPSMQFLLTRD